jgi:hypothetical protein
VCVCVFLLLTPESLFPFFLFLTSFCFHVVRVHIHIEFSYHKFKICSRFFLTLLPSKATSFFLLYHSFIKKPLFKNNIIFFNARHFDNCNNNYNTNNSENNLNSYFSNLILSWKRKHIPFQQVIKKLFLKDNNSIFNFLWDLISNNRDRKQYCYFKLKNLVS